MRAYYVVAAVASAIAFVVCYAISLISTAQYAPLRGQALPQGFTTGNAMFFAAIGFGLLAILLMGYVWTRDDSLGVNPQKARW